MNKINKLLILVLLPVLLIGTIVFFQNKDRLGARTDSGITIWGDIIGDISEQTDIATYIASSTEDYVGSITASTTLAIDSDLYDQFYITEMTATTSVSIAGTPTNGQKLVIGITASSTAQGLTWGNNIATSTDLDLPATTVADKTMFLGFIWNSVKAKWILLTYLNNI